MQSICASRFWIGVCLLGGAMVAGAQTAGQPVAGAPAATVQTALLQVVALGGGANVQVAGTGLSSLSFGHVSMARTTPIWGVGQSTTKSSFTVTSQIGLILDCGAGHAGRLATLRVFQAQPDARYTVTLDGTKLSTAPQVVGSYLACQSTTTHAFQLEVPVTAPAGAISPRLSFQATLQ